MNILITCNTMTYLSGSPMYNYTLALELARTGHDVTLLSRYTQWTEIDDHRVTMRNNLESFGVKCVELFDFLYKFNKQYDLAIVSQGTAINLIKRLKPTKIINVIHSEYDCEQPCDADEWIAIRPSIKDRLIEKYNINQEKIRVVYNGVDRNRFKKVSKPFDLGKTKIVIPCTLDPLREKFLNYWINKAKVSRNLIVEIYGKQCGAKLIDIPSNVTINPPVFNIEQYMANADYVAGILLGRVNLEANSMGIKSIIHDPDNPEKQELFFLDEEEFDKRHNIINIAKEIIR